VHNVVSAWTVLKVEGTKSKGSVRIMWNECLKVDMKRLGLVKEDARDQDKWKRLAIGTRSTLLQSGHECLVR